MLTGTPLSRLAPAESPQGNRVKLLRRYEACEKIAIPCGALGRGSESAVLGGVEHDAAWGNAALGRADEVRRPDPGSARAEAAIPASQDFR